jgi:hypothetical protein
MENQAGQNPLLNASQPRLHLALFEKFTPIHNAHAFIIPNL